MPFRLRHGSAPKRLLPSLPPTILNRTSNELLSEVKPTLSKSSKTTGPMRYGWRQPRFSQAVSCAAAAVLLACLASSARGEPSPGDVFREYMHTHWYGDAGGAIRVGGKQGESYPDRGSDFGYINTPREFNHKIDLEHATHAEVFVEKILSHNGTTGLAISWNNSAWIPLDPPSTLPSNAEDYYHHTIIEAPVGLEVLRGDGSDTFRLRVSPQQDWNWPQHLIYGVHLRVYYDPAKKQHAAPAITTLKAGCVIGRSVQLGVEVADAPRRIDKVEYIGKYTNVNWFGDGQYHRWQYFYYRGRLIHHIGSSVTRDFAVHWDTSWIPDQETPITVAARVIDDDGLIVMTPAVTNLKLARPDLSVELCKPEQVPDNWVTRNGEHTMQTSISGNLDQAIAARLAWSSWSPGYMNGLSINGAQAIASEGPRYRYFDHFVPVDDLSILRPGTNQITTGKTPLHDGKMVHGMEVNWPGIQLLIQYRK